MLYIQGQWDLPAAADIVWRKLQQMDFVVRCVPDLARVEYSGEREARLVVRPGLAFLRGEMTVHLQRETASQGNVSVWRMEMRGIGSSAQARITAQVEEVSEQASRLHYEVVLEQVGGLLRAVHSSLLQAAMEKTTRDFLQRVDSELRRELSAG